MGRVGVGADNAAMELFFSLLQKNVFDWKRWQSREELRLASVTWTERVLSLPEASANSRPTHTNRIRDN
jgi:hypothetical protein